jgi:hypothetical protein
VHASYAAFRERTAMVAHLRIESVLRARGGKVTAGAVACPSKGAC